MVEKSFISHTIANHLEMMRKRPQIRDHGICFDFCECETKEKVFLELSDIAN